MANMQIHKAAGVSLYDKSTEEVIYQDTLDIALADAEIPTMAWPDVSILRVFELADGRLAIVRETISGLRQETAPESVQQLFDQMKTKADLLVQKQQARIVADQGVSIL